MAYIDFEFKGSYAYHNVMSETKEQLLNRIRYTKMAVDFHTKEGNEGQIKFFTDELKLIEKRLGIK